MSRYNAEYFLGSDERLSELDLGYRVDIQSWVDRVEISSDDRSVRVAHSEGAVVHLSVNSGTRYEKLCSGTSI